MSGGSSDDSFQLSSQIRICASVSRDDEFGPRCGQFKRLFEEGPQFRVDRYDSRFLTDVVGRFRAPDDEPTALPINVFPSHIQML